MTLIVEDAQRKLHSIMGSLCMVCGSSASRVPCMLAGLQNAIAIVDSIGVPHLAGFDLCEPCVRFLLRNVASHHRQHTCARQIPHPQDHMET